MEGPHTHCQGPYIPSLALPTPSCEPVASWRMPKPEKRLQPERKNLLLQEPNETEREEYTEKEKYRNTKKRKEGQGSKREQSQMKV